MDDRLIITKQEALSPYIIAVASGKGGVGKSTLAVNLAGALKQMGLNVGILDADIYGPSMPTMLGLQKAPEISKNKKFIPHLWFGISCMSMGFLSDPEKALIWRGPMIQKAVQQLFYDVDWSYHYGHLDIMIVDMPPGTGDVALSLVQAKLISSVVMVSTAQKVAVADVLKAVNMFQQLQVPITGIIENMSYLKCSSCGYENLVFSGVDVGEIAEKFQFPLLGRIPLCSVVQKCTEQGDFLYNYELQTSVAVIYKDIAQAIWQSVQKKTIL